MKEDLILHQPWIPYIILQNLFIAPGRLTLMSHWPYQCSESWGPVALPDRPVSVSYHLGSAWVPVSGLLCMFQMLCDASSCNQAEHHCFPQSSFVLNWPIELDIWRIESQTQISSCQKRLIQTRGSKILVFIFFPLSHFVFIFCGLMREMIINISSCALRQMPGTSVNCFPLP